MKFEWDREKERKNIEKHKIDFETALRVFYDPNRVELYDSSHSFNEDRYITIGEVDGTFVILTVVYTERRDAIRIISARCATKAERMDYYDSEKRI